MCFNNCKLKNHCNNKDNCSFQCYPFTFLHGVDGKTGLWRTRNIPKKYENSLAATFPKVEPNITFEAMKRYMKNCLKHVENGTGMFLYSVPNKANPLGTGTGKTTTACSIVNEFLIKRTLEYFKGGRQIETNPVLFLKMAEFQNIYNGQFRGNKDTQEQNSLKYYIYKDRMKTVELLVIDDIAIRSGTETFLNEVYEVIDHRVTQEKTTIYTSNIGLKELSQYLGERTVSRIIGSTHAFPFTGEDYRLRGKTI
jgi:DNA replication protein DnaC